MNSNKTHKIIEKIGWPNFIEIPPEGFSGRIWLLWKNNIEFLGNILKTM